MRPTDYYESSGAHNRSEQITVGCCSRVALVSQLPSPLRGTLVSLPVILAIILCGMEIKMKKVVLASALLLSIGSVQAAENIRWDSASLSYQSIDVDGNKLKGFAVSGTKLINDDVYVAASYFSASNDDLSVQGDKVDADINGLSVGLGYRHTISSHTDLFGIVSYEDREADISFNGGSEDSDDNGYGLEVGIRSLVLENIELAGSLNYIDLGDGSDTGFEVSAMYHFTDQFSASVGYADEGDEDYTSISTVFFS